MNWYYVDQGKQAGPVDDTQLEELRLSGKVQPDTLVWREGMENWMPYQTATGQAPPPAGAPPVIGAASGSAAACAECGKMFPTDSMLRYGNVHVCAICKPVFMQKLAEGARINTGTLNYAGFWIRFLAKFVDSLILGLVVILPTVLMLFSSISSPNSDPGTAGLIFQLCINLGYAAVNAGYTIFFLGKYGATPGKMLCGLRVVNETGGKFGYGRATGRFFAEMLSGMICYIGYIMVAFDDEKRGLHDRICNTRVVYK